MLPEIRTCHQNQPARHRRLRSQRRPDTMSRQLFVRPCRARQPANLKPANFLKSSCPGKRSSHYKTICRILVWLQEWRGLAHFCTSQWLLAPKSRDQQEQIRSKDAGSSDQTQPHLVWIAFFVRQVGSWPCGAWKACGGT